METSSEDMHTPQHGGQQSAFHDNLQKAIAIKGKEGFAGDRRHLHPDASEMDGLGIWGTSYIIDQNNQDNYPLIPEFPSLIILLLIIIATLLTAAISIRKAS